MSDQKKYTDLGFLIVDDMAGMRTTVKNMLRMLGVSQTLEADDGLSAFAILKENHVGFIICDWNMPSMSGIELLEILKNMPEYRSIPFLMITAEMSEERIAQAAEVDVDSFLIKPFVANILQERIVETFNRITHPSEEMQAICQAQILKDNKKYDEAIICLMTALEKKERSARIMSMIGDINDAISQTFKNNQEEKKKYSDIAENWYKKAVQINPQYIKVYNSLGKHYDLLGEKDKALESYESASNLSPLNSTRMMRIGEIALETGHPEKADRAFEVLSKIQSTKKTDSLKEMGELYLKHGYTDKALKIFNKSLEELEDSAIYNRLGITLRKQHRFLESIEQYKKAIKLSPNDEVLYYNIGKAYLDAGNKIEAKISLEQAVKIDKDFVEAALELKKL